MNARELFKLAGGLALLVGAGVAIYSLAGKSKPQPHDAGLPQNWNAATRQYVQEQHSLAGLHLDKLQVDAARAVLEPLIRKYPGDYTGLNLLAQSYIVEDKWTQAYDTFARSLAVYDRQADIQFTAGVIAETNLRELEKARKHYRAALKIDPVNTKYLQCLSNVSIKLNDTHEAELAALEAIRIDPTLAKAHALLAEALARQNKITMALEAISKARDLTSINDTEATRYFVRHAEWLRRRDSAGRDEALAMLLAAPEIFAVRRDVQEQLARTYQSLNLHQKAAEVWARWVSGHPSDAAAAAEAGLAAIKAGDRPAAEKFLELGQAIKAHHPLVLALEQAIKAEN